ncbi:hypothetical protein NLI96_g11263 [Meripilus lineatus]|uniref:Uncharacterized protein n=1 Tax=Meripilus lineatus TaxID=2056292 RepID=A0AAD5USE7_9APHY|nr:hypothetical protein NLI96_g11263 [Physisporinus lineatus]
MLRNASRAAKSPTNRRLFSHTTFGPSIQATLRNRRAFVAVSSVISAGSLLYVFSDRIHNDSETPWEKFPPTSSEISSSTHKKDTDEGLHTLVWGSNKTHILFPEGQSPESVRTPADAAWLSDVALRDLVLHEKHAACIDARGDVYQWGEGFFDSSRAAESTKPLLTLRGKNIIKLQATPSRVFALSASGRIYVLASSVTHQELSPGAPTPASTPWWGTGWFWGEEEDIDFAEITPCERLEWKEKFVSIAAGNDHLIALTSTGRAFTHAISAQANAYGQLGYRKFDIPDREAKLPNARRKIVLTPKSTKDPYAKSTPSVRKASSVDNVDPEVPLDDSSLEFSDKLFEVPALRGIEVSQIAAGSRSSFVKTKAGRVLGWGANEFGQIGLGSNVTVDTVTVPTEIILWRSTPQLMRSTCVDIFAGGDLTFFTVERVDGTAMPYVDVLACGNGQWGGLGNALYTNAQGSPLRAKNVSGLYEYSEKTKNLQPIHTRDISVSPTGHVLLTLDTLERSGPGGGGRDLIVWGANSEYQLGNGKRGSLASPTALHVDDGERLLLGKKKAQVNDLSGKVWKKEVEVEQCAVAGFGNSVVYWKICS